MDIERTETVIGIDFGTTNTAVFELVKSVAGVKTRIFSEGRDLPFPSLLAISSDGKAQFGSAVKESMEKEDFLQTHTIISSFKSLLGTGKTVTVNGKDYKPCQLTANYLIAIKKYVKTKYNVDIDEAVLSYPVDFSPEARQELCEAANKANIKVNSMVTESTGAYLAVEEQLHGFSNVIVMDWGGGTFDISALSADNGRLTEKAVYGIKLGGDDIDLALAKYIHSKIIRNVDPDKRIQFDQMSAECRRKMLTHCERAKIEISETGDETSFTLLRYGDYGTKTIEITPAELNEIVKPIIAGKILPAIDAALERAEITPLIVDRVVIAGGSSNLAPYANAIMQIFGEDKILIPKKSRFISANGAAIMPFIGKGFKLADDVGILMADNSVYPILKKGEDCIGSHSETVTFSLVEDSRDAHFIITNTNNKIIYDKISIPTKGFLRENIEVTAEITPYQTVAIRFHNDSMTDNQKDYEKQINKLTFYYDLLNF